MKVIGILTCDFSLYYELIRELRKRGIPFTSLTFDSRIPKNVKVVLTSTDEASTVPFAKVVSVDTSNKVGLAKAVSHAVDRALASMKGFTKLIVGIDPGKNPGVVLVSEGQVLQTAIARNPEDVGRIVTEFEDAFGPITSIRIGNGDPTDRNRTINQLVKTGHVVDIVDESGTTGAGDSTDIDSAFKIATRCRTVEKISNPVEVEPTLGELKNLQRLSRLKTKGKRSISLSQASRVAMGEEDLEEVTEESQR